MRNTRERLERRLDNINIKAVSAPDRQLIVTADAKSGEQPIRLEAKATVAGGQVDGLAVPVDFKFDAPGHPAAVGDGKRRGPAERIDRVAERPRRHVRQRQVSAATPRRSSPESRSSRADLDFQRLDFEDAKTSLNSGPDSGTAARNDSGWSTRDIDLRGLNFVDGQINVSAATLGPRRAAPCAGQDRKHGRKTASCECRCPEIGLYEGQAAAGFAVDASVPTPVYALRANLANVRALQTAHQRR
jgi:AsmA protein